MTIYFDANKGVDVNSAPTPLYDATAVKTVVGAYQLSEALTLDQVIPMVAVPAGARITSVFMTATDLDTGGSPAIILAVGDASDDDRFVSGVTIGQTGGDADLNRPAGFLYRYADNASIDVKVTTAPATGATSGEIKLAVSFIYDPAS